MSAVVSGTYYKRVSKMTCLYYISSSVLLTYKDQLGIDVYAKATFLNGVKSVQGIVAISGSATMTLPPAFDDPGRIYVDITHKQWCSIEKESKDNLSSMYYTKDIPTENKHEISCSLIDDKKISYGSGTSDGIYIIKPATQETVNKDRKISTFIESSEDGLPKPTITTISL